MQPDADLEDLMVRYQNGDAAAVTELVRRLSGRWVCRRCAAIYQESSKPPRVPGRCDNCGGELIQRDDDRAETVRARLDKQKPPQELLDYFRVQGVYKEIDGEQSLDAVTEEIAKVIDERIKAMSNGHMQK